MLGLLGCVAACRQFEEPFLAIEVMLSFLLVIAMADGRIVGVMVLTGAMVLRLGFNLVLG